MNEITNQVAEKVYKSIVEYVTVRGYAPSQRELGEINCMSKWAIHNSIVFLEKEGFIVRERRKPRAIKLNGYGLVKLQ